MEGGAWGTRLGVAFCEHLKRVSYLNCSLWKVLILAGPARNAATVNAFLAI